MGEKPCSGMGEVFFVGWGALLFFPATGFRFHTDNPHPGELKGVGIRAMYLTATQGTGVNATSVWRLDLQPTAVYMDG